ncbi:MAG: hypothetical protein IJU00_04560, partial [Selenomonas sp.]|nr:hypothetical protein [Selenomonas sp.]
KAGYVIYQCNAFLPFQMQHPMNRNPEPQGPGMGPADAEITGCDFSPRFLLVRFLCAKENEQP